MTINIWYPISCLLIFVSTMFGGTTSVYAQAEAAVGKKPTDIAIVPLMKKPLAGFTGKEGVMLTVEYAPGASSLKHRHHAHAFVYVIEGSIVMQVEGEESVTLVAGQTFYESPNDIHLVSRNASASQRAKFVVLLVKDEGAPVVVPVK